MEPIFGEKLAGINYKEFETIHGVATKTLGREKIMLVRKNHMYFLPGGAIKEGEVHKEALIRLMEEKYGCVVRLGEFLGEAREFLNSDVNQESYLEEAYYYAISQFEEIPASLEQEYDIHWLPLEEAIEKLELKSQKWALNEWRSRNDREIL